MPVRDEAEIEAAVSAFTREPSGGLIIAPDPFINSHRALIVALADTHSWRQQFDGREQPLSITHNLRCECCA
jgi:hypothetical protein